MIRTPPRSTRTATLFPDPTLFRSRTATAITSSITPMTRSATACRRCVSTRSPGARTAGRRWFEGPASAARVARNPPPAPPLQGGETLGRFAIRRAGQGARGIEESHIDEVRHRLVRGLGVARGDRLEHAAVIGDGIAEN